jgi:hypothetical protein
VSSAGAVHAGSSGQGYPLSSFRRSAARPIILKRKGISDPARCALACLVAAVRRGQLCMAAVRGQGGGVPCWPSASGVACSWSAVRA